MFFIGSLLVLLSSGIIDIIIILLLLNFVFNRKNDKKKMILSFIASIIIFGIGTGFAFVGFLNFDVLSDNETVLITEYKEYKMNDDLFFTIYNDIDIKYIESEIDNIKLEYKINKMCELEEHKYENQNNIHIWASCSNSTKILKEFINNFNNEKIIPINNNIESIVIYGNKENINKLKNNWNNYIKERDNYDSIIDSYENKIDNYKEKEYEYQNEIEEYKNIIFDLKEDLKEYKDN